jgi:hypothetical protein
MIRHIKNYFLRRKLRRIARQINLLTQLIETMSFVSTCPALFCADTQMKWLEAREKLFVQAGEIRRKINV